MDELDKKLMDILKLIGVDVGEHWTIPEDTDVEQIKQAFIDAGWIPKDVAERSIKTEYVYPAFPKGVFSELMTKEEWERQAVKEGWQQWVGPDSISSKSLADIDVSEVDYDKPSKEKFGKPIPFMTGQEWYDRFIEEAKTYDFSVDESNTLAVIAKKAAGIE